ncbi:hypothetical protein KY366_01575 [Candidatus Woesearchaeota archaeon]|nr:hypothetical protein [Candidatus Woesearchaeota archaeon]
MVGESGNIFSMPPQPKKKGFFKQKDKVKESPVSEELEGTINRLRVLEERYTNLQSELRVTEENMINRNARLTKEIKALTLDINELRKETNEIKDKVLMIIKEFKTCAKKADVDVLQRYISMWEPMNFVTHNEIEEIIDEKLSKKPLLN